MPLKLNFQCLLINSLKKTMPKSIVNLESCTYNLIPLFLI